MKEYNEDEWEEEEVNELDENIFDIELIKHKSIFNWIMGDFYEKKIVNYQFRTLIVFKYIPRTGKNYKMDIFDEENRLYYHFDYNHKYCNDVFQDEMLQRHIDRLIIIDN